MAGAGGVVLAGAGGGGGGMKGAFLLEVLARPVIS
jgi:hypothetical protein